MVVEVPRGSFVKRELHLNRIEFVSPLPCPFNYGFIPETQGSDGDPMDALELGPRLPYGSVVERDVVGVVRFLDAGAVDDKLILADHSPSAGALRLLRLFFSVYSPCRWLLNRSQGIRGETRFLGLERHRC